MNLVNNTFATIFANIVIATLNSPPNYTTSFNNNNFVDCKRTYNTITK